MECNKPILFIIIPAYNESEIIQSTINAMNEKLNALKISQDINQNSQIVFVNDGSKDNTLELLIKFKTQSMQILNLSRNCGHQNALLAGLDYAKDKCDCAISIDCDLQDDINAIDSMIRHYKNGFEVVYGVRNDRKSDSFFKKTSAQIFYKLMHFLGANIIPNHADYRLLSARAIKYLFEFSEVNIFLRGIIPLLGFKSTQVFYKRSPRQAGTSKYPLFKMISFAIDGITSFSIKPIRILTISGAFIAFISFCIGIWAIIMYLLGETISGWTSLIISLYFLGGIQMIGLGILGEYIGKIYKESKHRPKYYIERVIK